MYICIVIKKQKTIKFTDMTYLQFWDNFDIELYKKIINNRNKK